MKSKPRRSKLSEFLAKNGVAYKWQGTWPAIPVALGAFEAPPRKTPTRVRLFTSHIEKGGGPIKHSELVVEVPPDAPPVWIENIYERLFEKILPLKKCMSLPFYDAAIYGYAYSAIDRERTERLKMCNALEAKSEKRLEHETLAMIYGQTLDVCRGRVAEVLAGWELSEAADYLKGFVYGIDCQHREESWTPSTKTETFRIYKALLKQQLHIKSLIQKNATAREIGEYIAEHVMISKEMTYADYFRKNPNLEYKEIYLKNFQIYCERLRLPLPPQGRPRQKHNNS
jgi:hypothetical protein